MDHRGAASIDNANIAPRATSLPLAAKLRLFTPLSEADEATLESISRRVRSLGPREDFVREGAAPGHVHLILSGWACRYKQLANGRRQIIGLLLPGDMSDLRGGVLDHADHSLATITAVTLAEVPDETMLAMTSDGSRLARALRWSAHVAQAIEREWIVSLGQRTALERMGHLFCELFVRLRAIGLNRGDTCELPLTQMELAEATGLSTVHVNRTLQELRGQGLIVMQGKSLSILDLERLQRLSLFNGRYLRMGDVRASAIRRWPDAGPTCGMAKDGAGPGSVLE